jgi:hypothetical protein
LTPRPGPRSPLIDYAILKKNKGTIFHRLLLEMKIKWTKYDRVMLRPASETVKPIRATNASYHGALRFRAAPGEIYSAAAIRLKKNEIEYEASDDEEDGNDNNNDPSNVDDQGTEELDHGMSP